MRGWVPLASLLAVAAGCGSQVVVGADDGQAGVGGASASSGGGASMSGAGGAPTPEMCAADLTGAPFIAMDGEPGYSHPVSVQLVGSHPVRVVASFDSDEDAPVTPPYLR
ncbi:MAG: hypothetical protein R3B72_19655, partial [Polyangiaceae bacterium]